MIFIVSFSARFYSREIYTPLYPQSISRELATMLEEEGNCYLYEKMGFSPKLEFAKNQMIKQHLSTINKNAYNSAQVGR